jgi:hypothetical protein
LDAISAMEFGARRIDFLGQKFQLADEMVDGYAQAQGTAFGTVTVHPVGPRPSVSALLSDINGVNGRLQDIIDGYSQLREMFAQEWNKTYRPSGLRPVLEHYDYAIAQWYARVDKVRSAQRQWSATKTLPSAGDLGIPGGDAQVVPGTVTPAPATAAPAATPATTAPDTTPPTTTVPAPVTPHTP